VSEGYVKGRLSLRRLVEVTSEGPARRYGLFKKKGSIAQGKDADLVLIDPAQNWLVEGQTFLSKGTITPFEGMSLRGKVVATLLRGRVIYDSTTGIQAQAGYGKFLKRGAQ
jgi:allantoinase